MEFTLVSWAYLTFKNDGKSEDKTMSVKLSEFQVDKLEGGRSTTSNYLSTSAHFLNKLEALLLAQASREGKRQRLNQPIDSRLEVRIFYGALSPLDPTRKVTGHLRIDDLDESHGLLRRLMGVCGGHNNIQAHVELEFGTMDDKMSFDFKDLPIYFDDTDSCPNFGLGFNISESLSSKWNTQAKFTGTLSLSLKLTGEALKLIHGGMLNMDDLVNRKLLDNAAESGDGIIVAENGKEFPCHKAILSAHSDVFKAMFNSDMKEGKSSRVTLSDMSEMGVKALLDYLYCCDIQEVLTSSLIAVELLRAADKYGIDKLLETLKDLILGMEHEWFSVNAAVQLLILAKSKAEAPEFKEMERKAKSLLKLKPSSVLTQCAEFRELFENPNNGVEMCVYLMQN